MHALKDVLNQLDKLKTTDSKLPVLFVGHGNPMNAIEDNPFSQGWSTTGGHLPKPAAILCISAHWETNGTSVTAMASPKTIHDFYGFPPALSQYQYPAPGAPEYAAMTAEMIKSTHVALDQEWGLDHGTWSVLCRMFPLADVPVYQLSLDRTKPASWHYALGKELSALRRKGVLIIGSGNMVHNLRLVQWEGKGFDWAVEFDDRLKKLIESGDHKTIVEYEKMGTMAHLSVPTPEHYLPLLYTLSLQEKDEPVTFFNDEVVMGSISMRSVLIG